MSNIRRFYLHTYIHTYKGDPLGAIGAIGDKKYYSFWIDKIVSSGYPKQFFAVIIDPSYALYISRQKIFYMNVRLYA